MLEQVHPRAGGTSQPCYEQLGQAEEGEVRHELTLTAVRDEHTQSSKPMLSPPMDSRLSEKSLKA